MLKKLLSLLKSPSQDITEFTTEVKDLNDPSLPIQTTNLNLVKRNKLLKLTLRNTNLNSKNETLIDQPLENEQQGHGKGRRRSESKNGRSRTKSKSPTRNLQNVVKNLNQTNITTVIKSPKSIRKISKQNLSIDPDEPVPKIMNTKKKKKDVIDQHTERLQTPLLNQYSKMQSILQKDNLSNKPTFITRSIGIRGAK